MGGKGAYAGWITWMCLYVRVWPVNCVVCGVGCMCVWRVGGGVGHVGCIAGIYEKEQLNLNNCNNSNS